MSETKSANGSDYRNWDLTAKSEYRFELEANTSLAIRLTSGTAEIYGAELALGRLYLFGGECRPSTEYTSDETPMIPLINIHTALEQMRILAHRALTANQPKTAKSRPPRVLVLGPENSGKTSACKIWCNYAIRGRSWCPTLINLDVNDGGWTIPGTMSACPLSSAIPTCTPANPFGATATSAPTALSSSALLPIVHWFGHTDPKRNQQLVEKLIRALADSVKQKFLQDHTLNASGFIIDTPAAFSTSNAQGDNKHNLIKTCVEAFDINTILIMGHDKLNVELQRIFGNSSGITVLKVPKSGGVVEVDYAYHARVITSQIRAYFYGTPLYLPPSVNPATAQLGGEATTETTLSPFSVTLNANELQIYRIGSTALAPSSALPIGATRAIGEIQPVRVDIESGGILHSVLALLAPFDSPPSDDMLLRREVSGFLIVTAVDIPRRKLTVLAPSQGSLVGRVALDEDFDPPVKAEEIECSESLLKAGNIDGERVMHAGNSQPGNQGAGATSSSQTEVLKSMYVTKLLEMIDTVLEYESHLFSPSDITILNGIKRANYFQQYLVSRIVQRKRGKWLRFDQLKESYTPEFCKHAAETDIPKIMANALLGLSGHPHLEDRAFILSSEKDVIDLTLDSDDDDTHALNHDAPCSSTRDDGTAAFTACSSSVSEPVVLLEDTSVATPAQLLECLTLVELKLMGKRLKVAPKAKSTREELINAILRSTSTQTTLPFAIASKSSNSSSKKNINDWKKLFPFKPPQVSGKAQSVPLQERRVRDICGELYGACFRLLDGVVQALHLVSVVYFRSTEQSEANSIMLSAILSLSGKRNYPAYEYKRTADVFPTRTDLLRYLEISLLLNEIENILAGVGQPQGAKFDRQKASQDVVNIWQNHRDRWNSLVAYLKDKSHRERGLERFEEGYLLTRLAYKTAECFGTLKEFDMEAKLLEALLRQTRWRRSKRGRWYDRIALIYTKYMGGGDANLRKARDYLLMGLKDDLVSVGSRPMLLRRLQRLEKQLRLPLDEQYLGERGLKVAAETWIEGTRIYIPQTSPSKGADTASKMPPSTMDKAIMMHFSGSPSSSLPIGSSNQRPKWTGKTIWAGKEGEVNVETLALEYYALHDFRGFHSEGAIVSTLFGLLFWDILFAPIPGAFETPYQSAPLDLVHDSFFGSREEIINARLEELRNTSGAARQIASSVYSREREREPWCVGLRWDLFESEEDLIEVIECLGGHALAAICRLLAEEYGSRGGGVPDLFIWNATEKKCKFVEVKGPGDNLSETQKVWINVLLDACVDVEVCHVYESGKMPAHTAKGKNKAKKTPQRRSTSRKRTPKAPKGKLGDKDHESDLESDEEVDELQSSSEDGYGATETTNIATLRNLDTLHCTSKAAVLPNVSVGPGVRDPPMDTSLLAKDFIGRAPDADLNRGLPTEITGDHSLKDPSMSSSHAPEANLNAPTPISRTNHTHTALLRPITSMPAPVLPIHQGKLILEHTDLAISSVTEDAPATQETVIPETPQATQHQPLAGSSNLILEESSPLIRTPEPSPEPHPKVDPDSKPPLQLAKLPNSSPQKSHLLSNKEWRDMLKTTPANKTPKGKTIMSPIKRSSPVTEPTPKRKRRDSIPHTPARKSVSTSAITDTTSERVPDISTDETTRTLRKRRRTTSGQAGVSGNPTDWEKKWPDVFPQWVGDLSGNSDPDYEPSQ
ncbi:unnamed protein product [Rhizoctonia solani]|uniref:Fanconi-associated nuclease n=1 Tax=Rhizoctonia solani TaxID=456999 RepID=A0A8H3DJ93_9AGAM|nr:unnamed protein product [Rhizoctonia solani]